MERGLAGAQHEAGATHQDLISPAVRAAAASMGCSSALPPSSMSHAAAAAVSACLKPRSAAQACAQAYESIWWHGSKIYTHMWQPKGSRGSPFESQDMRRAAGTHSWFMSLHDACTCSTAWCCRGVCCNTVACPSRPVNVQRSHVACPLMHQHGAWRISTKTYMAFIRVPCQQMTCPVGLSCMHAREAWVPPALASHLRFTPHLCVPEQADAAGGAGFKGTADSYLKSGGAEAEGPAAACRTGCSEGRSTEGRAGFRGMAGHGRARHGVALGRARQGVVIGLGMAGCCQDGQARESSSAGALMLVAWRTHESVVRGESMVDARTA